MDKNKIIRQLRQKLESNYRAYMQSLQGMDSNTLIDRAEEIAAAKLVYKELKDGGYSAEYLEYLLQFQNPLEVVRDAWITGLGFSNEADMMCVLGNLADKQDAEQDYELDEAYSTPAQDGGMKLC